MPRSSKRKKQLQAAREKLKQVKQGTAKETIQTCKRRLRNVASDTDDDGEAVYTEMLMDEFGKAMEDVFEIFKRLDDMADDAPQEHPTVTSRAAIKSGRPKKPPTDLPKHSGPDRDGHPSPHFISSLPSLDLANQENCHRLCSYSLSLRDKAALEGYVSRAIPPEVPPRAEPNRALLGCPQAVPSHTLQVQRTRPPQHGPPSSLGRSRRNLWTVLPQVAALRPCLPTGLFVCSG